MKKSYEERVEELEAEGLTTSDAQGVADLEFRENRKQEIPWKGHVITFYRGSNWAYIGNEVFQSVLGAKQAITRRQNK